jgi:hypothetical protein
MIQTNNQSPLRRHRLQETKSNDPRCAGIVSSSVAGTTSRKHDDLSSRPCRFADVPSLKAYRAVDARTRARRTCLLQLVFRLCPITRTAGARFLTRGRRKQAAFRPATRTNTRETGALAHTASSIGRTRRRDRRNHTRGVIGPRSDQSVRPPRIESRRSVAALIPSTISLFWPGAIMYSRTLLLHYESTNDERYLDAGPRANAPGRPTVRFDAPDGIGAGVKRGSPVDGHGDGWLNWSASAFVVSAALEQLVTSARKSFP